MTKRECIYNAFVGDDDIFKYFDPTAEVNTIDDVVDNIYGKIVEHEDLFDCKFIGLEYGYVFIVNEPKLLISFGVNINHRNKDTLSSVWNLVLDELGDFDCFLWSINSRAIDWLVRMGMEIEGEYEYSDNYITKLNYNKCH